MSLTGDDTISKDHISILGIIQRILQGVILLAIGLVQQGSLEKHRIAMP